MSRGVNRVILIGRLGADPEIRYVPNGGAIANMTVATGEVWKDKQTGENREKTEWHRVVIFNKLAEIAAKYLRKGSQVYIEGLLQTRKWQDQNGQDRYSTEIVVNIGGTLQILSSRRDDGASSEMPAANWSNNSNTARQVATPASSSSHKSRPTDEPPIDFDDDIPF